MRRVLRHWPLCAALVVWAAVVVIGCSSGGSQTPWAAGTQPVPQKRSPPPVASRAVVSPPPVGEAPGAGARESKPVAARPVSRPATTTTSSGEVVKTVRLFCDSNPTPIFQPNIRHKGEDKGRVDAAGNQPWVRNNDSYATLRAMGCRPVMSIYLGTLNRAFTWADDQGNPRPMRVGAGGGLGVIWAREGNFVDPPDPVALRACTRLAMNPTLYGDFDSPGPRPVMIDIESTKSVNLHGAEFTRENFQAAAGHMLKAIRAVKEESQGKCEVWAYAWFPMAIYFPQDQQHNWVHVRELERTIAPELSAACVGLYNWDHPIATKGESWFDDHQSVETWLKLYPQFKDRKVALVRPLWEVIWPQNVKPEHRAMHGKPIPLELWKRQIDALVRNGWDLYLWMPNALVDDVRPHLEYVARFAK